MAESNAQEAADRRRRYYNSDSQEEADEAVQPQDEEAPEEVRSFAKLPTQSDKQKDDNR